MPVNYVNHLMLKQTLFVQTHSHTHTYSHTNKRTDKVQKKVLTIASCVQNEDMEGVRVCEGKNC